MLETVLTQTNRFKFSSDGVVWIEALPARVYQTQQYGEVPITVDKLQRMVDNFKKNVRGQEIATDFDHGVDRAKGNKASGWYRDFKVAPSSADPSVMALYAGVEFTEEAKQEITNKSWKYFSLEWEDLWKDNSGNSHQDVVVGGGITNRPIAKNCVPINFSESWIEVDSETATAFAVWTTAYINDLPDSAFLYVESGGSKDNEGKTTPRDKRHFPYKDANGKIDLPHLRNAIARIPQSNSVSSAQKAQLQSRARRILAAQSNKAASEQLAQAIDLLVDQGYEIHGEVAEWEHSEPGTGSPPQPRTDGDSDKAAESGSRRDPLPVPKGDPGAPDPNSKGGLELTPEELAELRKLLGLPDDGNLFEGVKALFSEVKPLRDAVAASGEEKKFAEQYPHYWAEHQQLLEKGRANDAKVFSENSKTICRIDADGKSTPTKHGLSALAIEKVREVHKKFSEGAATMEDFEAVVTTITQGGIVEYGENGSATPAEKPITADATTPTGVASARKQFAEKVAEIQAADNLEYARALELAAEKYPDLARAYRVALPA